MHIFSYNQ